MCAGLLLFSQSGYFFGDESFHLLASQLINAGKRPYVDFFYPHTPLYIYLNAYWMRFFGEGWRSAHVFSALITSACVILVGMFVFGRLEKGKLREPVSIGAALLLALNSLIISCGTIAHPYALCLLFSFASYCFMTAQHFARSATSRLFFSGFCAGVAVSSSLLALPVAVILLLWMLFHLPNENRLKQLTAFIIGGVIPFLPLLWLAGASPRRVFFDVITYHISYRNSGGTVRSSLGHDLWESIQFPISSQGVLLMLLAILGFFFIKQQMQLGQREKKDLLLCGYLAIALSLFAAVARPTFERYYVISMPFLTVLAAFGIYSIGTRIMNSRQPALLVLIILALFGSGAVIFMYNYFHSSPFGWREIEKAAEEVNRTTPPNALLWSPEAIYATAHRIPPPGLENWFATKLELPPGQADLLHIRQEGEMKELLRSGRVGTLVMWSFNPAPNASDKLEGLQFFDGHEKYGNLEIWFHRSQGNR